MRRLLLVAAAFLASGLSLDVLNGQNPCEQIESCRPFKMSTPARRAGNQTLPSEAEPARSSVRGEASLVLWAQEPQAVVPAVIESASKMMGVAGLQSNSILRHRLDVPRWPGGVARRAVAAVRAREVCRLGQLRRTGDARGDRPPRRRAPATRRRRGPVQSGDRSGWHAPHSGRCGADARP